MLDWVLGVVADAGPLGVFFLMVAENLFPPIPSEVIMPLAGFVAARGEMSVTLGLFAGIAGTLVGNAFWYELARLIGADRIRPLVGRYGRWFAVGDEDLREAEEFLRRNGPVALFLGRLLPGIRTVISVPAGLVRIPRRVFYLWTAAGSAVWITGLFFAGFVLEEHYDRIEGYLGPLIYVVLAGILATYGWHLWRTRGRKR
jgi:membrane protein DedA with SNARE-associated domain